MVIEAKDSSGNESRQSVKFIVKDTITHQAYLEAVNLSISKLKKNKLGQYTYNDMVIKLEDGKYIYQDSLYLSYAKALEGFYLAGSSFYSIWGNDCVKDIFGFDKKSSYDEMKSYIDNVSEFIMRDKQLAPVVMNKFQSLDSVDGTFDFDSLNYEFKIPDLSKTAKEMGITEKMLGYILGALDVYEPKTKFEGISYYFELKRNI